MDINDLFVVGGKKVKNPKYNSRTKNREPEYITIADEGSGSVILDIASKNPYFNTSINVDRSQYESATDYGITVTPSNVENLQDILAESQSNWTKAFNALAQTVISEVGLGTIKAFSDIADAVLNGIGSAFFNTKNDYTNPISEILENWKEKFNNDVAPIYSREGSGFANGTDFGWWMQNIPSIASSLTLLIPGKAVTSGTTKLLGAVTKGRATAKTMNSLRKFTGVESLTSSQTIKNVKDAEKLISTGLVMRTAENYQEARGTYTDMKNEAARTLNSMTPEQYQEWVKNHQDYITQNGLNPDNKNDIAERIASDAANTTFREDFANIFFDIAQLWSLRDATQIFRKVKSTKVMSDHRASMQALNKTSDEIAEAASKTTKFGKFSNTLSDVVRGTGKAVIGESTEGIEEAVNYIAQQEGMTVGKTILEDLEPTTFGDRLTTYMSDPQLWESAFWGLAGGVIFQGFGSAYNQRNIKKAAKKDAKKREKNDKTGESVNITKWYELEEMPEIKAARAAVNGRISRVTDLFNKLADINNGINIFGNVDPTTKQRPNFEGSADAIKIQQERARTSVIDQFVADITTDAIHSGTYDLLKEYLGSNEMIEAISKKLNINQGEATSFVNNILNKADYVKREYAKQINHISSQVADINAKNPKNGTVPLPYIQILAKQNLDKVLNGKNLDDQYNVIREQINALRSNPAFDGILDKGINYEDVMLLGTITQSYTDFEAQKKAIKANNEISELQKLIKIDSINKKQNILLKKLENITTINGKKSSPIGRLLYTLKYAYYYKLDENNKLVPDKDAIEKTDKEILKDAGYMVTDLEAEEAAKSFDEYEDTLSAFDNLLTISKKEIEENDKAGKNLKEISDQLYNRYKTLSSITLAKDLNFSDIATTKKQIAEQIDIIHNQNNANRIAMIKKAEENLLDLYSRYDRRTIDNLIALAVDGHSEQAKALAKEQLKNKDGDGILFEDTFDILNLNTDNNIHLAQYVKRLIDGKEWTEHIERIKNEQKENSSTSEKSDIDQENNDKEESLKQQSKNAEEAKNTLNKEQINTKIKGTRLKGIVPEGAKRIKGNSGFAKRGVYSIKYSDGKYEAYDKEGNYIEGGYMTEDRYKKLIRPSKSKNNKVDDIKKEEEKEDVLKEEKEDEDDIDSSTGGLEVNPILESLKESLNNNFNYLEIKGEDDIKDNEDFDIEKAVNTVWTKGLEYIDDLTEVEGYVVTPEAKNELKAILNDRIDSLRKRLTEFKENLNKKDGTIDDAASALAMASKIGIIGNEEQLPNIFVVGFENFIDYYIKTAITPIKDGKKVISVQEILNIVGSVIGDKTVLDYLLDKMRKYLNSPEVTNKYVILDKDNLNKEFNLQNSNKDEEEKEVQKGLFRVNILDYADFYNSENASEKERSDFFKILNELRKGDQLDIVVDGKVLFIKCGDTVIGTITKAMFENNGFLKVNKGWVEDVKIDAGGDIHSNTMDIYKRILTSDIPTFVQLRDIILETIVNKNITQKNINDFINSDFIQNAIKNKDDSIISQGGQNINSKAKDMIEHLVKIYNYSTQGITFKTKEERINKLNYAIENYFANLYNDYDIISRINKDTKINVEYINDGEVNTKFEVGTNHHKDLPFIGPTIIKSKAKLGFFDKANNEGTTISGEDNGPIPPNPPQLLKVLAVYDRNDAISYVTISQLNKEDYNSSDGYQKILVGVKNHLNSLLNKAIDDNNEESFNNVVDIFRNLIYNTNQDEGNIPLFIGYPKKQAYFKYNKNSNKINIFFQYTDSKNYTGFTITKNKNGITFSYVINGNKKEINSNSDSFTKDVSALVMDIIQNNCLVNIDTNGIISDNNPQKDISSGFIHRKNGKIIAFEGTIFEAIYDSYNDFIINNGLARVNLNEPKNGTNFVSRGREQRLNQVMYVSMDITPPVEEIVDTNQYSVNKSSNKNIDIDRFNRVYEAFENKNPSGKDLFIAAFGEEAYNDMLNVAGEFDIMEAILPISIVYNPNLNSAENSSLEAKTNPTNHTIRVNVGSDKTVTGRTRVQLSPGQVMVGDKFISMISSLNDSSRKRAIAVMIHERLHWLIANNPNYTRKEILDNLKPIYDEFFKRCQEVVDSYNEKDYNEKTATDEQKAENLKYRRAKKAIEDFKRYNNTKTYPDPLTKFDEFLVETITNIDYNALMNDFKQTEKVEKGEDNIFTKLLKFIMKYLFHREVKNDSLLEQEFNTLTKLLNNREITTSSNQKTVRTFEIKNERKKPEIRKVVTTIRRENNINDMFADDEDSSLGVLESYYNESITGFVSSLPIEQQSKFNSLLNNNQFKYKCVIK